MRRNTGLLLALAALGACGDGLSPELRGAELRIHLNGVQYDQETISIGQSIQLVGAVLEADGDRLADQVVTWSTDAPAVATVDGSGVVTGVGLGEARITATHRIGSQVAVVTVARSVQGSLPCAAGEATAFAVAQTRIYEQDAATTICLAPGQYSVVLANTGSTAAAQLPLLIASHGAGSAATAWAPADAGFAQALEASTAGTLRSDDRFHQRLRGEISERLEPRLRAGIDPAAIGPVLAQAAVNQVLTFNVETGSSNGCSSPDLRGGRVRAVGQRSIVVADTLNPSGGFTDAEYAEFAAFFDTQVWPLVTGTFGTPSDLDQNGKAYIFFTRAVNERPENSQGSGLYVGGFFFNRDLFPKTGSGACEGSNVAEMFYMLVPDPNGEVTGRRKFLKDFVAERTRSVLTHEFQHLVNDSRRLHVNRAPVWEETWLNEALSHLAEEMMFYELSGLRPEMNLDSGDFGAQERRDLFAEFQLDNLERFASFARNPSSSSLMGADILATRGAGWHFLRYAADRHANEQALWRALVTDTKTAGLENLEDALGVDPREWVRDWAAAVDLDDLLAGVEPRFTMASWNLRELYPQMRFLWGPYYVTYPLKTEAVGGSGSLSVELKGGGASYLRATASSESALRLRVTQSNLLPPPPRLKVMITRTG